LHFSKINYEYETEEVIFM